MFISPSLHKETAPQQKAGWIFSYQTVMFCAGLMILRQTFLQVSCQGKRFYLKFKPAYFQIFICAFVCEVSSGFHL